MQWKYPIRITEWSASCRHLHELKRKNDKDDGSEDTSHAKVRY